MSALVYLRVSTAEQSGSGLGLDAQEFACLQWARDHGLTVAGVYRDEGLSGARPLAARPGLSALVRALKRGDTLLAARRDRIARTVEVMGEIERAVRKRGAAIVTPEAPTERGASGDAMRGVLDVFSAFERRLIGERTAAALARRRAAGLKCGGSAPYGFACGAGGVLVPSAEEQAILRRIRRARARGSSVRAIAESLNRAGVAARGSRWHATTIARLLRR